MAGRRRWVALQRDTTLFLGGVLIALHETVISDVERPSLLVLAAGMMGLPAFLRKDEDKGKGDGA